MHLIQELFPGRFIAELQSTSGFYSDINET